jgi:hypothetical protein
MIELTQINNKGAENLQAEKQSLYSSGSYRATYQAYRTLRDKSEIVDKRSKFY